MDKEVAGHRYTHERTHTTPDLGKSNGLREANLDLKHKSQACSQGEPIDQKYEWSHVSIEHQVGKVSHDEKDEVFSSARVKLILEFETKCYLQTICLSGRGSGREVRGKEGGKEEKGEEDSREGEDQLVMHSVERELKLSNLQSAFWRPETTR